MVFICITAVNSKQPYFCQAEWKGGIGHRFSDGGDEEMKDDVDSVRGLLDRLKEEKERELLKETSSNSAQENGIGSVPDTKQDALIGELQKRSTSLVMNLKSVVKTKDSPTKISTSSQKDASLQNDEVDNSKVSQKRKQDSFLVEVQERAEVISKSARKAPETTVSSIGQNVEEDPDTEEFLRKIRAAPTTSSDLHMEVSETRVHRSKSASEVDFSVVVPSSSALNLEPQKSKIPLGRSGSLKGRRKPTAAGRRKSLKSSLNDDWDDSFVISEGEESMDEEESVALGGSFIIKDPPQMGAEGGVRPRTKPKPKMKSQTVSGISLPGLAEALSKKQIAAEDKQRSQGSAAEIVRAAAEGKRNMAVKEEKVEKEPDKPAWLVEAEARRKLHEQRRHTKAKQQGEGDGEQTAEKPVQTGHVLRSLPQRPEPVVDKSDSSAGMNVLNNVMLRPVRKPEAVATKSDDDNDATNKSLNVCLRPVSKPDPVENQVEKKSENSRHHNVFLRPISKPEPVVNGKTEDSPARFQPVRLKPLVKACGVRSSGSTGADSEAAPMASRTSSEVTTSNSPPVKPVTQSFSHTVTPSRVQENGEALDQSSRSTGSAKTAPEHHIVRTLAPITSEKPMVSRSEPKVSESPSSRPSGSRVTVSSNYVSAPYKIAPKTRPKPSHRSKTVTVTASEVPDLSKHRRTSVELIHAKVERKPARPATTTVPDSHVSSHGDLRGPRRGSDTRDRPESHDSTYKPTYTGDVLPQWKIDLIEKKKNVGSSRAETIKDLSQQTPTSNAVVVPAWRRELAEKRKQRVEVNGIQTSNKENEPKTSPEVPQWKKEFAERRKRREMSPARVKPDKRDRSPETPEWQRRLANTRRTQPIVVQRGPTEDSTDQVPSFMKEFEKKKRTFPREVVPEAV
ncbi:hypothetical protein ACROYT_G008757 [Oculina patagonica]